MLGRPDLARECGELLLAATQDAAAQPNSLAALHAHLAQLHLVLREGAAARRHAEEVVEIASRQDLPLWLGLGRMYLGAALVEDGRAAGDRPRVARGIAEGLEGMAVYRATGAALEMATCLCWFAAGHAHLGRPPEGLRLLDEASRVIAATGETYFAAEVHRLASELNLALNSSNHEAAEASLRTALAIARRQRSKLLELRAGVSLARLWCNQGRRAQARELLAGLCGSFTECAAGADLDEARASLAAA